MNSDKENIFNYKEYIESILNKKIIACEAITLAVKRHASDLEKSNDTDYPYFFDETEAEKPIRFIQNLSHSKGKWAIGQSKIRLEGWQQFIIASVFGWRKKKDNLRRFRKAYIQVARKNGKTTVLSGIANYAFFCDSPKEPGVEIYFIATKKEQAKLAWEDMERMIRKCPALTKLARTYKQTSVIIKDSDSASKAKILGQDSNTEDGLNPHFIGVDEFHAHPSDELINVLESGTGARRQPLTFIITTAGFDKNSVCYAEYIYLKKILRNEIENDEYFAAIFEPDENDDWKSKEAIIKSNPNLDVSTSTDIIVARIKESLDKPHQQVDVKTKNLNIWTQSATTWIPAEVWAKGNTAFNIIKLAGRECFAGLDLSTTRDITAYVLCFPINETNTPDESCKDNDSDATIDEANIKETNTVFNGAYILLPRFFMPKENIRERSRDEKVPYELWAEQGYITFCGTDTINFDTIENYILADSLKYKIKDIGYDAWKAKEIIDHLVDKGLVMTPIRQSFALGGLSEGTAIFEKALYENKIIHGGNPVLSWMVSNTEVRTDGRDNWLPVKPDRRKSVKRIDGVVASIMAVHSLVKSLSAEDKSPAGAIVF